MQAHIVHIEIDNKMELVGVFSLNGNVKVLRATRAATKNKTETCHDAKIEMGIAAISTMVIKG